MLGTVHLVQTRIIEVSVILLHLGTKRPKGRKQLNHTPSVQLNMVLTLMAHLFLVVFPIVDLNEE